MLLLAVREGDCEPIKVSSILVSSGFRSMPSATVPGTAIRVLSFVPSAQHSKGFVIVIAADFTVGEQHAHLRAHLRTLHQRLTR